MAPLIDVSLAAPTQTHTGLIDLAQARQIVLANCAPLPAQQVALEQALGRTLAESIIAGVPVPAFDNSAMDGFAVRAEDLASASPQNAVQLRVVGESRAGHPCATALAKGEAIAISTGAMMPSGADTVLRLENARLQDGTVSAHASVTLGSDVRRVGDDIRPGERVLEAGAALGPVELGVLACLGRGSVSCTPRPRVRILLSGDELVPAGAPLRAGAVHDSNAHTIGALCARAGAEVERVAHVRDEFAAVEQEIARTVDGCDLAIVCGGVSVGAHDHVRRALAAAGAEQLFAGIALRPGRPTWFGGADGTPVFALPGNPVSAVVAFVLLVGPALRALAGADPDGARADARMAVDYDKRPGRAHAVRCRLCLDEQGWLAHPTGPQGSHILTSLLGADALAMLPRQSGPVRAGQPVEVEMLAPWVEGFSR